MSQASCEFSLYIPRVALSSSGSSSKGSSHMRASKNNQRKSDESEAGNESDSEETNSSSIPNYGLRANRKRMYYVHKAPKRASISTKSSSASSSSNFSVNSLLLSVRNLENFNKSSDLSQTKFSNNFYAENNHNVMLRPNLYSNNFVINYETYNYPIFEYRPKNLRNIGANNDKVMTTASKIQEKEADAVSTTSTTNFTVVSFNDSNRRLKKSKAICRRSQQITILVLFMTIFFIILILLMLFMLDMRNKKMPR